MSLTNMYLKVHVLGTCKYMYLAGFFQRRTDVAGDGMATAAKQKGAF